MRLTNAEGQSLVLSAKVGAIIKLVIEQQAAIEALEFGWWEVRLTPKKVTPTLAKSFRGITFDDPTT